MSSTQVGSSRESPRSASGRPSVAATLFARRGWVTILLLVTGLAIWRLAFVSAGVDPDSDAYGHHAIARQVLVAPRDLTVHWVWLPFFHYAQAFGIALGASLQSVRYVNVALAAIIPLFLYAVLRRNPTATRPAGLY